jgi:hypothetical protein
MGVDQENKLLCLPALLQGVADDFVLCRLAITLHLVVHMLRSRLKQDVESFLCEMIVMRQDFADAILPHRLDRKTVGQAVSLVGACLVEGQAGKEGLVRLQVNRDGRISVEIANKVNRFLPEHPTGFGKRVQNLGQDLFGCDQVASPEGTAGLHSSLVPLIFAVGDRNPVKRIDEDPPHGVGRFGVP